MEQKKKLDMCQLRDVQILGRSNGYNALAAAAYRAGVRLVSPAGLPQCDAEGERTVEQVFDYRNRGYSVSGSKIMLPEGAPEWAGDRQELWEAVELSEKRKDAQLAREFHVAFPHLLPPEVRRDMLEEFLQKHFVSQGMVADYALHDPGLHNDWRNFHAHVMLTMRELTPDGFAKKKNRDWNKKELVPLWREAWAELVNEKLQIHGIDAYVDHRSFEDRGLETEPQKPVGKEGKIAEQIGLHVPRVEENKAIQERNRRKYLSTLTEFQSAFTEAELRKAIEAEGLDVKEEMKKLRKSKRLIRLKDPHTGRETGLFTTNRVKRFEQSLKETARRMFAHETPAVSKEAGTNALRALGGSKKNSRWISGRLSTMQSLAAGSRL